MSRSRTPMGDASGSRTREAVWAALLAAGTLVPLSRVLPWIAAHGLDVPRFLADLFANPVSAFFAWDVILSVATLLALAALDRELPGRQRAAVGLASLLGASVGLPLWLLLRERHRSRGAGATSPR